MQKIKLLAAVILLTIGSGCSAPPVIVEPVALPLPGRPFLERVEDVENRQLQTAFPDLHEKLVINDARLKAHIRRLESIIRSTHKAK